jgi:hypothetical protein
VSRILESNLFFSDHAIGRKVRSPVDLTVGLLRSLNGSTNARRLADELVFLGQGLFYPPNVKGWDGGRAWINASMLLGRANVVGRLLRDKTTRFGGVDLESYFRSLGIRAGSEMVDVLSDLMLAVPLPKDARDQLVGLIERRGPDTREQIVTAIHALTTLPEFQLG